MVVVDSCGLTSEDWNALRLFESGRAGLLRWGEVIDRYSRNYFTRKRARKAMDIIMKLDIKKFGELEKLLRLDKQESHEINVCMAIDYLFYTIRNTIKDKNKYFEKELMVDTLASLITYGEVRN